ncbi:MAG: alpha/beta hydrolase [Mycobacterium sp.]
MLVPLVIVTLVASGVLALLWSQQRRLIYFPSPGPVPSAAAFLPNGRDVVLDTEDGIRLGAWYFPVAGRGPAVLVCNGNAGDRSMRLELAAALNDIGLSVLLFDYRGYGGNPGQPSEDGLAADARAAQAWLAAQPEVDPDRIAYFGESLGAGVAVGLATERPPAALVLRSPFTSLADVGRVHYPWLPVGRLLIDRYPSIDRIGSVDAPVLVIAGDRDDIVPTSLSKRLYEAAPEPKRFVLVSGAGHNDAALLDGRQMLDEVGRFLSEAGVR